MLLFTKQDSFQYLNTIYIIFLSYTGAQCKLLEAAEIIDFAWLQLAFFFFLPLSYYRPFGLIKHFFLSKVITTFSLLGLFWRLTAQTLSALTESVEGKSAALEPTEWRVI